MFEYNYENLSKVVDSKNILYFKTCSVDKKRALYAMTNIDDGVYEKILLTEPQNNLLYPIDPIKKFSNGPGSKLLENFIFLRYDHIAINKDYLNWIEYVDDNSNNNNVVVFARFKDGSCTILDIKNKDKFFRNDIKRYKEKLEKNNIVRGNIPYNIGNPIIEFFLKDNIATIPTLQKKDYKSYIKKFNNL